MVRFVLHQRNEEGLGTDFLGIVELQLLCKGKRTMDLTKGVYYERRLCHCHPLLALTAEDCKGYMKSPPMLSAPFRFRGRNKLECEVK